MPLPTSQRMRLLRQLDTVDALLAGLDDAAIEARPPDGSWSIREHLAHLGRYHEVFLARLARILAEDAPAFGRYRADDDPDGDAWMALPLDEVRARLAERRRELIERLLALSDAQLTRVGSHPKLGAMDVRRWTEFFLLHEAHHLYAILWRTGARPS